MLHKNGIPILLPPEVLFFFLELSNVPPQSSVPPFFINSITSISTSLRTKGLWSHLPSLISIAKSREMIQSWITWYSRKGDVPISDTGFRNWTQNAQIHCIIAIILSLSSLSINIQYTCSMWNLLVVWTEHTCLTITHVPIYCSATHWQFWVFTHQWVQLRQSYNAPHLVCKVQTSES